MTSDQQEITPDASLQPSVGTATTSRFYTPWQICVGAILGGPLAAGYFYSRDHVLFGSPGKAKASLIWSVAFMCGLFAVGIFLPAHGSGTGFAIGSAVVYRWTAKQAFDKAISLRRDQGWVAYSWWRVVGLSIIGLILSLAIAFVLVLILPDSWFADS
jgi:hypothetical protein